MIDNKLYEYMAELLKRTPLDFIRYKYDEINWNGRLIGIPKRVAAQYFFATK